MRFGKIDDIKSRVAAAIDASRQVSVFHPAPRKATGAANWAPTPLWNPTTSCCTGCWAREDPARTQKCANEILNRPERRRRLADLQRRPVEHQRVGEGVFRAEDGRLLARSSAAGEGARAHSGAGRRDRGQHLHQDLSLLPGPVRLRRGAGDSAGDRAVSQLVLVQHLRDFFVVARHSGAAVDCLRQEAVQEDSRRRGN